jgi:D-lyxose ketol-isomerase
MISRYDYNRYKAKAAEMLEKSGILITTEEKSRIEIVDFGQSRFEEIGLAMLIYFNTARVCARELIMFPHQTIAQQIHPDIDGVLGKEETFRCRWGKAYVYVPGEPVQDPACRPPKGREEFYDCKREIVLNPCDQYTMLPNVWHWLQAGPEGAVISEFSSPSQDETDLFSDPEVKRFTEIIG